VQTKEEEGMVKRKLDGTVDESSAERIHKPDAIVHNP